MFFVKDTLLKGWRTVVKNSSRHAYSVPHAQSDDEASEAEFDNGDEDDMLQKSITPSRRKRTT